MILVINLQKGDNNMAYKYATIDIESTGLSRFKDKITYSGVGLAEELNKPLKKIILYDFSKPNEIDDFLAICDKLKKYKLKLIWQGGKFDTLFVKYHLGRMLPISHDTMLMGTAYDMTIPHGLKDMAMMFLGVPDWDIDKKTKLGNGDRKKLEEYLAKDVKYTWALFNFFTNSMNPTHIKLYQKLLKPAYLMYRDVEETGIYFDKKQHAEIAKLYGKKQKEALKVLTDQYDINWNSPAQVSDILFNKAGLPQQKLTKKGAPSSDAKVLKRLVAKGYELPQQLLDYKFYYGANSKFLKAWPEYASYDGRIHPNFGLTNVITGRTSCSDPNLQQVPRNKDLRALFTADSKKNRVLIEADYSQLELRIAADDANETTMLKVYRTGGDIHTETAKSLSGKDQPSKEDRSHAKPVNFGFLYGMLAKGFVDYAFDNYGVVFNRQEAERYRQLFFLKYPRLLDWHREMEIKCEMDGGVYNRFGRFRSLPKIYSQNKWERGEAVRRAINTPVQGTGSDLLLGSAVEINKKLKPEMDLWVVGTVHDSILMDCPVEYKDDAILEIKKIMEHPEIMDIFDVSFKIPIVADVSVGAWGKGIEM